MSVVTSFAVLVASSMLMGASAEASPAFLASASTSAPAEIVCHRHGSRLVGEKGSFCCGKTDEQTVCAPGAICSSDLGGPLCLENSTIMCSGSHGIIFGVPGSTCCGEEGRQIACAPDLRCNNNPADLQCEPNFFPLPNSSVVCHGRAGRLVGAEGSSCCGKYGEQTVCAPSAICSSDPSGPLCLQNGTIMCSGSHGTVLGAPGSTCCGEKGKQISCAPGFECNNRPADLQCEPNGPPLPNGTVVCHGRTGRLVGAKGSSCCGKYGEQTVCAPGAICSSGAAGALCLENGTIMCSGRHGVVLGAPGSTCCGEKGQQISCAPGFQCNNNPDDLQCEPKAPPLPIGTMVCHGRAGRLVGDKGSSCCGKYGEQTVCAPGAICSSDSARPLCLENGTIMCSGRTGTVLGAPGSTCCGEKGKQIACAPGFECNNNSADLQCEPNGPPLPNGTVVCHGRVGRLVGAKGSSCCGKYGEQTVCAPGAICSGGPTGPLCLENGTIMCSGRTGTILGAPGSTCCGQKGKQIACAPGFECNNNSADLQCEPNGPPLPNGTVVCHGRVGRLVGAKGSSCCGKYGEQTVCAPGAICSGGPTGPLCLENGTIMCSGRHGTVLGAPGSTCCGEKGKQISCAPGLEQQQS